MKWTYENEIEFQGNTYYVTADCNDYREHYGADADGNRGIDRSCREIENVKIFDIVGDEFNTKPMENVPSELNDFVENKIINYERD